MKKIIETLNVVVVIVMLLMTVGQILFRSVIKVSASWSEELVQYSFAFIVFIGAVLITKEESHITISMGLDMAPPFVRRIMRIIGRLVVLPFMGIFTWGAWQNTLSTWATSLPTVDWVKIGYMYAVLFVSGVGMVFYLVKNTILDIQGKIHTVAHSGGAQ